MLRSVFLSFLFVLTTGLFAQDTVCVLFLYGSKPNAMHESRQFGGLHGGHVSVQYKSMYASFVPKGKFHVFNKKSFHSKFVKETKNAFVFDTSDSRYMLIRIPVTPAQKRTLDSVITRRLKSPPYDYAFFGMRCASAAYELLSSAGIFPRLSKHKMVRHYFYPRKLRKIMLNKAKKNGWQMTYAPGRTTRKWEKD